jgi:DNA-binding MarR family transcriptional regulator
MERMIARVPDATRLLDRMEAVDLIVRQRSSEDRRFVTTRITSEGLDLLARLDVAILELHERQFAALDQDGLRVLTDLLGAVRESG